MTGALTGDQVLDVGGRRVTVSSLDRVVWPEAGVTKAELIDYYVRVAGVLLPHLTGRPVTLHRFPEGLTGKHFFQTRTPPHPPWVRTVQMHFASTGKTFDAAVVDDLASLVWAANLTTIELHPFLGRTEALDRPSYVVFDLDPGAPAGLEDACGVGLAVRDLLAEAGLASYAKTSGGKGLHVYVPLNTVVTYAETKAFAREAARVLTQHHPDTVVDRMTRAIRAGKVFVDWSQNDPGKSTVAPYSLRAMAVPTVSMPLTWDEVATVARRPAQMRRWWFGPAEALVRVASVGDLFGPVLQVEQRLPG